jgi:hypothetical protein
LFQGLSLLIIEHYRWGNTHARLPHYKGASNLLLVTI